MRAGTALDNGKGHDRGRASRSKQHPRTGSTRARMSGLGGFLFGNIDEEGRLDDEDLDEV